MALQGQDIAQYLEQRGNQQPDIKGANAPLLSALNKAKASSAAYAGVANKYNLSLDDLAKAAKQLDDDPALLLGAMQELTRKVSATGKVAAVQSLFDALSECSLTFKEELAKIAAMQTQDQKVAAYQALLQRLQNLQREDEIFAEHAATLKNELLKDYSQKLRAGLSAQQNNSQEEHNFLVNLGAEKGFSQAMFDPLKKLGALIHAMIEAEVLVPMWEEKYPGVYFKPNFGDPTDAHMKQMSDMRPPINGNVDPGAGLANPASTALPPSSLGRPGPGF